MNISELPPTAFISPRAENLSEIERFLTRGLELILANAATAAERSPLSNKRFGDESSVIPDFPIPENELFENLREILAGSMNAANPNYIGHMDSLPTTASMLGDLAAAAVNNNLLSLEMSPVFSRLENELTKQFARLFGFGEEAGGVMLAGGSLANLQALAVARNAAFDALEKGIARGGKPPVLFASEAAHASVQKAAMLLGFGTAAVIKIAVNADSQMETDDLRRKIEMTKKDGQEPFAVVATAGTTVTGNIDPLPEIARIAAKNRLWFHVDAAYGGALIFSEKYQNKLAGIESADSITFNPQKWLYVAKTCAMVLFRNKRVLQDSFRVAAPYMRETEDFTNIGEISVQGTHHADVLKLRLSLQHLGKAGYAGLIEESFKLTDYFIEQIKRRDFLQFAAAPELNLVCFRCAPRNFEETALDELNARLQGYLLRDGNIFLSLPLYRRRRWLRAVLLNPFADEKTIRRVFEKLDEFIGREESSRIEG